MPSWSAGGHGLQTLWAACKTVAVSRDLGPSTRVAHNGGDASVKDKQEFQNDEGEFAKSARGFQLTAACALKSNALFTLGPRRIEVYSSPSRLTRIEVGG